MPSGKHMPVTEAWEHYHASGCTCEVGRHETDYPIVLKFNPQCPIEGHREQFAAEMKKALDDVVIINKVSDGSH